MALVAPQCQQVFHHYPRTGGSAIRELLGTVSEFPTAHASVRVFWEATEQPERDLVLKCALTWDHFGMVRNPYDVVVSLWANSAQRVIAFGEFVQAGFVHRAIPPDQVGGFEFVNQSQFYAIPDGRPPVWIGRFERDEDREHARKIIGTVDPLRHVGKSDRVPDWRVYYDRSTADLVTRVFEADFERFGYERFTP